MAFRSWLKVLVGTLLSTTTKGLFQFNARSEPSKFVGSGLTIWFTIAEQSVERTSGEH
jgi:hypothetical protein